MALALASSPSVGSRPTLRLVPPVPATRYWARRAVACVIMALTLWAVSAAVHLIGGALVSDPVGHAGTSLPAGPAAVRLARPGETYWSIAAGANSHGGDLRAAVDQLVALNHGAALIAGEPVHIPRDWVVVS